MPHGDPNGGEEEKIPEHKENEEPANDAKLENSYGEEEVDKDDGDKPVNNANLAPDINSSNKESSNDFSSESKFSSSSDNTPPPPRDLSTPTLTTN